MKVQILREHELFINIHKKEINLVWESTSHLVSRFQGEVENLMDGWDIFSNQNPNLVDIERYFLKILERYFLPKNLGDPISVDLMSDILHGSEASKSYVVRDFHGEEKED